MSARKEVKVRVRPDRGVFVDGVLYEGGAEVSVPADEADVFIADGFAEKPDEPLDDREVRDAEQARAVAESEDQRAEIDRRMARGMADAQERRDLQDADEDARIANAMQSWTTEARAARQLARPLRPDETSD